MTRRQLPLIWALATALLLGGAIGFAPQAAAQGIVRAVGPIGMTVADADRSIAFYSRVLGFEKVSDLEVWGREYEQLQGVFGLRMRVVRLRLGDESIELTEYLTPKGRPMPLDARANDRWFQHVAIIVSDMDRAYARLREHRVQHASPAPQRLPDWNPKAVASSSASTIRPSSSVTRHPASVSTTTLSDLPWRGRARTTAPSRSG